MKALIITLLTGSLAMMSPELLPWVLGKLKPRVVERVIHVEKPEADLKTLIKTIPPQYGLKPELMAAILHQESGGKRDAIRFEPGQLTRAAKYSKDPEQQKMLASSHGPFQIMGWWAPELKMDSWSEFYDLETNVDTASLILSKCMDRHKNKSRYEQIHGALTCYNGSTKYADAILNRLGQLLIERSL